MDSIMIKVVGAIGGAVFVLAMIPKLFGRTARLRRRLRSATQRAIHGVPPATPCRFAGMVTAIGDPLIAPLSGRACVYYETRVVRSIGLETTALETTYEIAVEQRTVPFVLDDGSGCATVDATHAQMLLGTDVDLWAGDPDGDAAAQDAFLARFGQRRRGLLFAKRLLFTESIIEVGERICVMGEPTSGAPWSPSVITDDPTFTPALDEN